MKRNFHCLIILIGLTLLTGCESAKYAYNQTLGDQREFSDFQTRERDHSYQTGVLLADADNWVKDHLW